jgi:hypothetical protein
LRAFSLRMEPRAGGSFRGVNGFCCNPCIPRLPGQPGSWTRAGDSHGSGILK